MPSPDDQALTCPQCGALRAGLYAPCQFCGAKFIQKKVAKAAPAVAKAPAAAPRVKVPRVPGDEIVNGTIGARERKLLGGSAAAALVVLLVPVIGSLARAVITVLHGAGHCLGGWVIGYPSFPVLTFDYPGPGAIGNGAFWWPLAAIAAAALALAAYHFRRSTRMLTAIVVVAAVWLLFVSADWRRDIFYAGAGHLTELLLATTLLYRSLGHRGRMSELIAQLEAFAGFAIVLNMIWFFGRILGSRMAREWYRVESGTGRADLFVIAGNLKSHLFDLGVAPLAFLWLVAALLPLAAAVLLHRHRGTIHRMVTTSLRVATA